MPFGRFFGFSQRQDSCSRKKIRFLEYFFKNPIDKWKVSRYNGSITGEHPEFYTIKEFIMKKFLSLMLAALLLCGSVLAFASCGKGIPVGVQTGTTGQFFVDGDADWGFSGIEGYAAKGYNNGGLAVSAMKNGSIDYVIIDEQPAKQLAAKITGIKVIDIALTEEEYAFGVDKAQPELYAQINAILVAMKATGALDAIVSAYATGEGITPVTSAKYDASKKDTQLVVATNANFAPFEYKEGDKFAGIDMEIAKYIADALQMELVIQDMEFEAVVSSVGTNNIDVAMAGLTVNEERKQSVNFTESYYNAAQMLIVLDTNTDFDACTTADSVIAKLEELAAK